METNPEERHTCDSDCIHFQPDVTWKYDGYCDLLDKWVTLELEKKCSSYGKDQTLKLW